MDKDELKKILHEQFEPIELAAKRKLMYLQSDNVFLDAANEEDTEEKPVTDSSLEDAFSYFSAPQPVSAYEEPKETGDNTMRDMSGIRERKQNIAARIAAIKGLSMPGDYLSNK